MAQRCDVCGKGPAVGNSISHAHKLTRRRWLPNLVSIRAQQAGKVWRIGLMGCASKPEKVAKLLDALETLLAEQGRTVERGAAAEAAKKSLAP